jgi:hypothetical protein
MPFVKMPGVIGKVYVPEPIPGQAQKHPCLDCFACQQCSDDRCTVCRPEAIIHGSSINCRRSGSDAVGQCHHHRKQQH